MEICARLGIARCELLIRRRNGLLPGEIQIKRPEGSLLIVLWEREALQPHLDAWIAQREAKRGAAA